MQDQETIDKLFDKHFGSVVMVQNKLEQDIIFSLHGPGSHTLERMLKAKLQQQVVDCMLYLGVWISSNGNNTREVNARVLGAWIKWNAFRQLFCKCAIPVVIRRICFGAHCCTRGTCIE